MLWKLTETERAASVPMQVAFTCEDGDRVYVVARDLEEAWAMLGWRGIDISGAYQSGESQFP
jgi:hypothetical protein